MFQRRRLARQRKRHTLEDRWLRNFLHHNVGLRWAIGIVALAALISLSVFNEKTGSMDMTAGQICSRTIIARVNFSYEDENATILARNHQASLAPHVYRLSMDSFQRGLKRIQDTMERVSQIKQSGKVTEIKCKEIADNWNEQVDLPLKPYDIKTLSYLSDWKIAYEILNQTGRKLLEEGVVGDDQLAKIEEKIIAYGLHPEDFSQLRIVKRDQLLSVSQARQQLIKQWLSIPSTSRVSTKVIESFVGCLLTPNLTHETSLSVKFQEQERERTVPVYRAMNKGEMLVEQGERLTKDQLVMLQAHEAESERTFSNESRWRQRIATAIIVMLIMGVGMTVLTLQTKEGEKVGNREYALLMIIILVHIGFCRSMISIADFFNLTGNLAQTFVSLNDPHILSILPFCFGPILAGALVHRRRAYLIAFLCSFLLSIITQFNFNIMVTSLVSAFVGIHFLTPLRRRAKIYEAGLAAGIAAAFVNIVFGYVVDSEWRTMGLQSGILIGTAFFGSLLASALLPVFESIFKVTTDLRWLELADLNHPLLRRMVIEAPGTYHHSLMVANLAERACEAIQADALQARVCSYFHDIGKLKKPEYFCENQVGIENPHNHITPNMSALILISHVKDGVDMAIQHHMVRPIIDTIQQHHGASQVTYFYRLAKQIEEDTKLGSKIMLMNPSDVPRVHEENYRYPGPKPKTKEIAIISLADSIEGASRSLVRPTPQKIETLVNEIIEERVHDGQLDDCPLNFRELKDVADSFTKTILSMMHTRVSYPKDEPNVEQSIPFPSAAAR